LGELTILNVFRIARSFFLAYEACLVDIFRGFHGSWFIGAVLLFYYLIAFITGCLIGLTIHEAIEPLIDLITVLLRPPQDVAFDAAILFITVYAASSATCIIARTVVKALTYLGFEMREGVVFYSLVLVTIGAVLAAIILAILPPILHEDILATMNGLAILSALALIIVVAWIYVRYRWSGNSRAHKFDRDIGLAWSHMSDPRRAKFDFGGGG
jgi:hypothetical protein